MPRLVEMDPVEETEEMHTRAEIILEIEVRMVSILCKWILIFGIGENGGHGEDAPMANNGDHSDNLSVLLDRSCHIKELVVKYSRISHRTPLHRYGNNNVIDEHQFQSCSRFPLNSPNEFVMMKANGGNGGNGGRGGNGGSGGNGGNGAPGTLEGGDGGDGGHGGNAGRPSNGGNGGNAGSIEINVCIQKIYWLTSYSKGL